MHFAESASTLDAGSARKGIALFTLAHLSDPHLGPLPPARIAELMSKRALGYLSWRRRRSRIHLPEVLAALSRDLAETAPDHIAVTGDLTNIALPAEFEAAEAWLHGLGPPERVSVVPGNHDAYVGLPWPRAIGRWAAFMADAGATPPAGPEDFPYVRRRGRIALVGLSTAVPTAWHLASGRLGAAQLERLAEALAALGREGCCRVLLLHHPPAQSEIPRRKRLVDADAFRRVVAAAGAELVLHGHDHSFHASRIPAGGGEARVFGVPSASAARAGGRHPLAHYLLHRIEGGADGWRLSTTARGYDPARGGFAAIEPAGLAAAPAATGRSAGS